MAVNGTAEVNLEMGNHPNGGEEVQGLGEREMGDLERVIYLQVQLYADEENDSPEIKRKKRTARTALTMWKENIESRKSQILQGQSQTRSIMNEVYQLVSLYSVFVGVVLTAVATSSRLVCQHLWSPVGLSLFAYFMLVVVAFTKFRVIRYIEAMGQNYGMILKDTQIWVYKLRALGYADFDFDTVGQRQHPMRSVPSWRNALGLTVPLTIFTTGLVFSFAHILCWS